jgi:hypothetical protein
MLSVSMLVEWKCIMDKKNLKFIKAFLRGNLVKIDYCEDKQKGRRIYVGEYLKKRVSEEERRGE